MIDNRAELQYDELVFDWNRADFPLAEFKPMWERRPKIHDEIRDALQATYVTRLAAEQRLKVLTIDHSLGIDSACIGFPSTSEQERQDLIYIGKELRKRNMLRDPNTEGPGMSLTVAVRADIGDLNAALEVAREAEAKLEVGVFLRSSQIGTLAQGWTDKTVLGMINESITYAVDNGLSVMFVAEDATRTHPRYLDMVYREAIRSGADRLCIPDTVGSVNNWGLSKVYRYLSDIMNDEGVDLPVDVHLHDDLDRANTNAEAAIELGFSRVHATWGGIGERSGNTKLDVLLVTLDKEGVPMYNPRFAQIKENFLLVTSMFDYDVPKNYPVFGEDAQTTQAGVHASALWEAMKRGINQTLAGRIYLPYDPERYGLENNFKVGWMSGGSVVKFVLERCGVEPTNERINNVLKHVKSVGRILSDREVVAVANHNNSSGRHK
ncbi:MAG: hypothetical protein M1607_03510 [Patescibacteria group bacterium]|nr:hypothetical protein [Patescibacteria group bacterium]